MLGFLIEDVTLLKGEQITAHVRFRGGATTTLSLPALHSAAGLNLTDAKVIALMDELLAEHTPTEVAAILNERGLKTGAGEPFTVVSVKWIQHAHGLKSLRQRLRAAGMLTATELATRMGVRHGTVKRWRAQGKISGRLCNDLGEYLYDPPSESSPHPERDKKYLSPPGSPTVSSESTERGAV